MTMRRRMTFQICAVLAAMIVVLRLEGRTWWCACGRWNPWTSDVWGEHNSQHLFDPYSLTHFLHGFVFCGFLYWWVPRSTREWRFIVALVAEALWEIFENSPFIIDRYRAATLAQGYEGDSVLNSLGDVLSCATGVVAAHRLGVHISIYVFVAVEGLLLVWIRDNLTLNLLMLLFPIEAIKQWQSP